MSENTPRCPKCGSGEVVASQLDDQHDDASTPAYRCQTCGAQWAAGSER